MSLINLGSKVAFEAMISLATATLMATYLISIGCALLKRLRGETLPLARWSLGRYGLPVNAVAILYTSWSVSWDSNSIYRISELSAENQSYVVLLGLLASHLQSRHQYFQLGMSALLVIHWLCATGLPVSCEAYIPGPSHYHRCLQCMKEVWMRRGRLRYKTPAIDNYNYSGNYLVVDQFILSKLRWVSSGRLVIARHHTSNK
jgi:amino acid transporter